MEEVFTRNTIWNRRGKPPVIRLSNNGHIRLSVEAVKILGVKEGDTVSFMVDNRDNGIFYFYKDEDGMPLIYCTRGKDGINGLQLCCRPLAQRLLKYFGFNGNKTFDVSGETIKASDKEMWFVLKEKIHKPINWKKKDTMI